MRRLTLVTAGLLMALALAACSSASAEQPTPAGPADPGSPHVVAQSMAFQPAEVSAPAGKPFQIVFENKDSVPHNVAVYRTPDFKDPVSVGEVFSGQATRTQSVAALAAGTYYFRCDVHPDMKGTLVVK